MTLNENKAKAIEYLSKETVEQFIVVVLVDGFLVEVTTAEADIKAISAARLLAQAASR